LKIHIHRRRNASSDWKIKHILREEKKYRNRRKTAEEASICIENAEEKAEATIRKQSPQKKPSLLLSEM